MKRGTNQPQVNPMDSVQDLLDDATDDEPDDEAEAAPFNGGTEDDDFEWQDDPDDPDDRGGYEADDRPVPAQPEDDDYTTLVKWRDRGNRAMRMAKAPVPNYGYEAIEIQRWDESDERWQAVSHYRATTIDVPMAGGDDDE